MVRDSVASPPRAQIIGKWWCIQMENCQDDRNGLVVGWVGSLMYIFVFMCVSLYLSVRACVLNMYTHIHTQTHKYQLYKSR